MSVLVPLIYCLTVLYILYRLLIVALLGLGILLVPSSVVLVPSVDLEKVPFSLLRLP